MSEIIQGDSGVVMQVTIRDSDGFVNLTSAQSVEFTVKSSAKRVIKSGTFVDRELGIVEFVLDETDVDEIGNYVFQATVYFNSGKKFSSDLGKFKVGQKL